MGTLRCNKKRPDRKIGTFKLLHLDSNQGQRD